MVRFMREHADCGVSGCRLYRADESYAHPPRRFQTLRTLAARRLGAAWLHHEVDRYLYLDNDHRQSFDCDWLSGCFLMVRRKAFEEIGFLDTQFRKYFEDVDFCLRMATSGWRVMFNGETYCYHLEQRASRRWMSKDALLHAMSYWKWLRKWGFHPERHVAHLPEDGHQPRRAA
jgi:GT2 family glycosyltransferase